LLIELSFIRFKTVATVTELQTCACDFVFVPFGTKTDADFKHVSVLKVTKCFFVVSIVKGQRNI
jgi:hypothetical protein